METINMFANGRKVYQERILVYIDILGFRQLIEEARDNPSKITEAYDCLQTAKNEIELMIRNSRKLGLQSLEAEELRYHTFSDTITISCVYKSFESFDFMAFWTMLLQNLIRKKENKFLRGAIVYGDLYDDEGVIFGPAIVEAYDLAENRANWPRIIVSQGLLTHLEERPRQIAQAQFVRKDEQGLFFIDYLRDLFHNCIDNIIKQWSADGQPKRIENPGFLGHPLEFLQNHKDSIEKAVSNLDSYDKKSKTKIINKYKALSEYHNKIIYELCEAIKRMTKSLGLHSALSDEQLHNIVEYTKTSE